MPAGGASLDGVAMAVMHRRDFLKVPLGASLAAAVGLAPRKAAAGRPTYRFFQLDNGFRTHVLEEDFGYTSMVLSLRSDRIRSEDGLAHLMEHTSFVGAAGDLAAPDVRELWKDHIQDSNATTAPGEIAWQAKFLPQHLPHVIEILAMTSLAQKFDLPTVEQERQVVLQELYAAKYSTTSRAAQEFDETLYGRNHPMVRDTLDAEIAHARQPAERLVPQLRALAEALRLPANMNLYVLGTVPSTGPSLEALVQAHFGSYPKRQGPAFAVPPVPPTVKYHRLTRKVRDLSAPLSELEVAWNTSVTVNHKDAAVLTVVAAYLNSVLFDRMREQNGDAYSPEASFQPNDYSGIFYLYLATTKNPRKLERNVFKVLDEIKAGVPERQLTRFREQLELTRRREKREDDTLLDNMVQRNLHGLALSDLDTHAISADQVVDAARRYLPGYRGRYVRLVRVGSRD